RSARKQRQGSGNREMHTAICADCGREAQVPFAPNPERPVYCRDCYASRKDKASNW
ncbi:MAG TPA: hypothetical protein DDZ65_10375, partial [Firmicutes bacterium]|nr:hypothetical protein [Bacillota bacterium]